MQFVSPGGRPIDSSSCHHHSIIISSSRPLYQHYYYAVGVCLTLLRGCDVRCKILEQYGLEVVSRVLARPYFDVSPRTICLRMIRLVVNVQYGHMAPSTVTPFSLPAPRPPTMLTRPTYGHSSSQVRPESIIVDIHALCFSSLSLLKRYSGVAHHTVVPHCRHCIRIGLNGT